MSRGGDPTEFLQEREMNRNPVLGISAFKVPESNVFLMTRFRKAPYHQAASDAISEAVGTFGLELVRADNPNIHVDDSLLWTKVQFCMEACHHGVALFETIDETDLNPDVSLELGYMMALERKYLVLKEERLRKLHSDLCGHLYKTFDCFRIQPTILAHVADWLKEIGVRKHDNEKLVVFVSYGGQDRCAIAKAITNHLFEGHKFALNYRIESRAAAIPSGSTAASTAIQVVEDRLGRDYLSGHRPRKAGVAFLFEADLILATDERVLAMLLEKFKSFPGTDEELDLVRDEIKQKTFLLSEFFGGSGRIDDPFNKPRPYYEECFDTLYRLISDGLPRLADFLERDAPHRRKLRSVSFGDGSLSGTMEVQ